MLPRRHPRAAPRPPDPGELHQPLHPIAVPAERFDQVRQAGVVEALAREGVPDVLGDVVVPEANGVRIAVGAGAVIARPALVLAA